MRFSSGCCCGDGHQPPAGGGGCVDPPSDHDLAMLVRRVPGSPDIVMPPAGACDDWRCRPGLIGVPVPVAWHDFGGGSVGYDIDLSVPSLAGVGSGLTVTGTLQCVSDGSGSRFRFSGSGLSCGTMGVAFGSNWEPLIVHQESGRINLAVYRDVACPETDRPGWELVFTPAADAYVDAGGPCDVPKGLLLTWTEDDPDLSSDVFDVLEWRGQISGGKHLWRNRILEDYYAAAGGTPKTFETGAFNLAKEFLYDPATGGGALKVYGVEGGALVLYHEWESTSDGCSPFSCSFGARTLEFTSLTDANYDGDASIHRDADYDFSAVALSQLKGSP